MLASPPFTFKLTVRWELYAFAVPINGLPFIPWLRTLRGGLGGTAIAWRKRGVRLVLRARSFHHTISLENEGSIDCWPRIFPRRSDAHVKKVWPWGRLRLRCSAINLQSARNRTPPKWQSQKTTKKKKALFNIFCGIFVFARFLRSFGPIKEIWGRTLWMLVVLKLGNIREQMNFSNQETWVEYSVHFALSGLVRLSLGRQKFYFKGMSHIWLLSLEILKQKNYFGRDIFFFPLLKGLIDVKVLRALKCVLKSHLRYLFVLGRRFDRCAPSG